MNLMPQALNFERSHVLAVDVLEQVLHAPLNDGNQRNVPSDFNRVDVVHRTLVAVWELDHDIAIVDEVLEHVPNLDCTGCDPAVIGVSLGQDGLVDLFVEAVAVQLDVLVQRAVLQKLLDLDKERQQGVRVA